MTLTIHKGHHRPRWWWLHWPYLWYNKTIIRRHVTFSFDCKYDLGGDDQDDHNKLFGIGYFIGIHQESARFGWRYDLQKNKFILSAYCYVNGQRITRDLCEIFATKKYLLVLIAHHDFYEFSIVQWDNKYPLGSYTIPRWRQYKWSYPLGLYFGGNRKAPQEMNIEIKKA